MADRVFTFVNNVFSKLDDTARVSELMARNYYKMYVKDDECIFDLDEFKILSHIIANPDLSQSDISKLVYKGKAHIGKILNDMEKKNYIKRVTALHNNIMVKNTVLTEFGKKMYERTDEKFRKIGQNVLKSFSEREINELMSLLDKLKNSMIENNKIYF